MTLIRIAALSLLLGTAVAGVVWFSWGAATNLLRRAPAEEPKESKDSRKDAGPGKAA